MDIKVYFQPDGKTVIRWPKGAMPDEHTIERLYEVIRKERNKEAVAWAGKKSCLLLCWFLE